MLSRAGPSIYSVNFLQQGGLVAALALALFTPPHLVVLGLVVALPLVFACVTRRDPAAPSTRWIAWALFAMLMANKVVELIFAARNDLLSIQDALPMHLCDWTTIAVAVAL